jgi:TubC N-terminal docking domain
VSPAVLVASLQRRGCRLLADGDRLGVHPADVLTDELRAAIREHKPALLAIVVAGVLPCPRCARPLDAFEACWECPGRLCQVCGVWMAQRPYSHQCEACQAERFAQLSAARDARESPAAGLDRLHPCPACIAQGRMKLVPRLWTACAVCDPSWRGRIAP